MKLTKRSTVLCQHLSVEFCKEYFASTVKHFKQLSTEIQNSLESWLSTDTRDKINTVDFDLKVREFYNHDKARERTWVYWTRRGWSEEHAAEKVAALQGATRKQNIARLTTELGSEQAAIDAVRNRDRAASFRCDEFWLAKGFSSEEAKIKVFEAQQNIPTEETKHKIKIASKRSLEYWVNTGLTEIQAVDARRQHQNMFNLEKCIEELGEEAGLARWNKRQTQWQETLDAKPIEEQERIAQAKGDNRSGSLSNISTEMFKSLTELNAYEGARWGLKSPTNLGEYMLRSSLKRKFMLDFVFGKKVIEFNGDFWHANPRKYKSTALIRKHRTKVMTAQEIWDMDKIKQDEIIAQGYELLVIWEGDYRNDRTTTVLRCIEFLNS